MNIMNIGVHKTGSKGALLDEYEKAILELIHVITDISDLDLVEIVDNETMDPDCKSIQGILTHVVHSGFGYAHYIYTYKGNKNERPARAAYSAASEYIEDLKKIIPFNRIVFEGIVDAELEEFDNDLKIKVPWGQSYDIEQLMEHAIVHILKHRRQIERFRLILQNQKPSM
jgi:hypothetical protein